ncbi:hypothetical protein FF098_007775 [Parvularcula flava]|uniref:DUF541 domain-containing protein n=1 Tax=Aquisalinus luteolus TaxID=1566827 RepID=A0A8J3ER75_9PROT|nr:hypothetical protein [Aquisalinus luteolus]NHK27796.1 hypothetical protein [Aquisalinus luteolus]GGH96528.1 hypothetical protein GCM10011355_15640 [Aquisalinus luteolus]
MRACLISAVITAIIPFHMPANAQSDEIVVTGTRLSRYEADIIPAVTLTRDADFVLKTYSIVCDTRDRATRLRELTGTLEDLIAKADRRSDIELSIIEEYDDNYDTLYFPRPFDKVDPDNFTSQYGRTDTSMLSVTIKTPVTDSFSTLDQAEELIEDFVDTIRLQGRTEFLSGEEVQLSVRNVERYRPELLAAILAYARQTAGTLEGTETEIAGLEQVVRWERAGPMELTLYLPYKLSVSLEN